MKAYSIETDRVIDMAKMQPDPKTNDLDLVTAEIFLFYVWSYIYGLAGMTNH